MLLAYDWELHLTLIIMHPPISVIGDFKDRTHINYEELY